MSPQDPLEHVEQKDPKLTALLRELAVRDNWALLEQVFSQMQEFAYQSLIECTSEEQRIGVQALASVTNSFKQRLTRYRGNLKQSKPIVVT